MSSVFLAHDAFVRTNRRAIAMMFIRLSGTGVHYYSINVETNQWRREGGEGAFAPGGSL